MPTSATGRPLNPPRERHFQGRYEEDRSHRRVVEGRRRSRRLRGDPSTMLRMVPLPVPGRNGFTLVELLVVVTIIGLLSAVVVLALPDGRGSLIGEAERFAARAKAMRDKATIDARATSIRVSGGGYAFDQRVRGDWVPLRDIAATDVAWDEGTQALVPGGETLRIVFDATGIAEPVNLPLQRGADRVTVTIGYDGKIDVAR